MIEALLQAERLLLHGMVDQAEEIYRSATERDPNNAIAVVGLARVALERGDDHAAYEHTRAALVIDPQNAAALRLEARLSEVLTERGERVERPAGFDQQPMAAPSEPAVFARNRSMADARQDEQHPATATPPVEDAPDPQDKPQRRGLMRRLLGR